MQTQIIYDPAVTARIFF